MSYFDSRPLLQGSNPLTRYSLLTVVSVIRASADQECSVITIKHEGVWKRTTMYAKLGDRALRSQDLPQGTWQLQLPSHAIPGTRRFLYSTLNLDNYASTLDDPDGSWIISRAVHDCNYCQQSLW